jgi:hypothetical protein
MKANSQKNTPERLVKVKKQVAKLNNNALQTADNLVENSLTVATKWQDVFAKAMKGGTDILAKQQDMTFTVLETLKGHLLKTTARLRKMNDRPAAQKSKLQTETFEATAVEVEPTTKATKVRKTATKKVK